MVRDRRHFMARLITYLLKDNERIIHLRSQPAIRPLRAALDALHTCLQARRMDVMTGPASSRSVERAWVGRAASP
jgi:hypothetical protein